MVVVLTPIVLMVGKESQGVGKYTIHGSFGNDIVI